MAWNPLRVRGFYTYVEYILSPLGISNSTLDIRSATLTERTHRCALLGEDNVQQHC